MDFIYSFIQLFIYVNMKSRYLFYALVYNTMPCYYFVLKVFHHWQVPVGSFVSLAYPHHCVYLCLTLPYSLALQVAPGSSCTFLGPPRSPVFKRSPASFSGRSVLEVRKCVFRMFIAMGVGPFC